MALHHTQDAFLYFFRCYKDNTLGTLPILNLPMKSHLSLGWLRFSCVILVSNYHSYKEKTKLLPNHSFYGGHIPPPQEKLSPLSWQSASKNTKPKHQDPLLAAFP